MKKIYSLALIVLSLFSCLVFSACGDKYKKLTMSFYSSEGEKLDCIEFVMDSDALSFSKTIGIEFSHVNEDDIGQVVVYSLPNELVSVSNYRYRDNMCYVDINPNMPSGENAKLVVSHLASGKKTEIDLKIDRKSDNLNVINSKYVISIPESGEKVHNVDFSQVVSLLPAGSTDNVYFKIESNPVNVGAVPVEEESLTDVYSGFKVPSTMGDSTESTCVKIYPVTYMKGYEDEDVNQYRHKQISIYFKHTLNADNVKVEPVKENLTVDLNALQLIANDDELYSIKLALVNGEKNLNETDLFDMYEIGLVSADSAKITTFADGDNNIVVAANSYTDNYVDVKIVLNPINYVGELEAVEKTIKVKGEIRSDTIKVVKNGQQISTIESTNIFDYYEEGNSLGSLFNFKAVSKGGIDVHNHIKDMRILVKKEILCSENCQGTKPDGLDSKLYSLMFHNFNQSLTFTYDENLGMMVSETIYETSRIYIKYVDGGGTDEPTDFGIKIQTITSEDISEFWKDIEPTVVDLNFNRLEGIKNMSLEAGYYGQIGAAAAEYHAYPVENPEYIYLNRREGLDNNDIDVKYINVKNGSVKGVDGGEIPTVDLNVKITPLTSVETPLTLTDGLATKDIDEIANGVTELIHTYNRGTDADVIGLVFRANTSIGDYEVVFSQEGVKKASVICRVYESLDEIEQDYICLETNKNAFKNNEKYDEVYRSDYIVAAGEELDISIDLPDSVLNSGIVKGYYFDFVVGVDNGEGIEEIEEELFGSYFEISHDRDTLSNAILKFIKGTYIDKIQYVYLTITVDTKVYQNIVTEAPTNDDKPKTTISFFIYDVIKKSDISINHTSMTRYYMEYLGKYYESDSSATLQVQMNENLWNYITKIDNGGADPVSVDWKIDNEDGLKIFEPNEKICDVQFKQLTAQSEYIRTVKAYVYQFENIFELQCVFNVKKPILSERLIINSDVKATDNSYYINLKNGGSYKVDATNYSSKGEVTNPDIIIQVADEYGSAFSAQEYFDVDQTSSTITVKKVDGANKFKLIIFAKDVLAEIASSDKSQYNTPSVYIIDFEGTEKGMCKNAYFIVDIFLSDGTEENPYLITNANDFWQIDDTESYRSAHYWVMNTISLNDTTDINAKTILNFGGSIKSYNEYNQLGEKTTDNVFMIDGIVLNNNNRNVFGTFDGTIKDLKFVVEFNYSCNESFNEETLLGLFASNDGLIENVSVEVDGIANLTGNSIYYFGGLVGKNSGEIINSNSVGVAGTLSLNGTATVYFGGLVGKNIGTIKGAEGQTGGENEVILNSSTGRDKALSLISIESSLVGNSAIGGLVGINTYYDDADDSKDKLGTISNVFVQTTIIANSTSNVGGVIGVNLQQANAMSIDNAATGIAVNEELLTDDIKTKSIYNVKSASTIVAKDKVGGIVGYDENGLYIECDYQILISNQEKVPNISAQNKVGGIAGSSKYGKFAYCSVMSYNWDYNLIKVGENPFVVDVADISGVDYVGGIVGYAESSSDALSSGVVSVSDKTIVVYSSINAFAEATKYEEDGSLIGNIGGVLSSESGSSILCNVYFIGKLTGNVVYSTIDGNNFALDNNLSSIYNAVYSINFDEVAGVINSGAIKDLVSFDYDENRDWDYWWYNVNINGGYIYVTTSKKDDESHPPIFDISPDSIEVSVKGETEDKLKQILRLNYYDFSENEALTDALLLQLNKDYNQNSYVYKNNGGINVGLIDIDVKPAGIGQVVINVMSTNTRVIDITYDGRLLINGVGECELIFSSALNPNAGEIEKRTIKVVVDYPIGNSFKIATSKTDESKIIKYNSSQAIANGTSKHFYVITEGYEELDLFNNNANEKYYYKTKENTNLKLEISYATEEDIKQYVSISGQTGIQSGNLMTVLLDNKTPLTISVLKYLESGYFNVKIKPFTTINSVNVFYDNAGKTTINEALAVNTLFKLYTRQGATSVALSYDDSIVYPNDTIYLTAHLQTDIRLTKTHIDEIIKEMNAYVKQTDGKYVIKEGTIKGYTNGLLLNLYQSKDLISYNIFADSVEYDENTQILTIVFRIEFKEMLLTGEEMLLFELNTENGNSAQVEYTILPQRINKIEIKNYYYKNVEVEPNVYEAVRVQDNVLKPNSAGEIIIDIVPYNGYYSYLEISDITGNEEILFIQVDEYGNALSLTYNPSSDNKGIKLYGNGASRLYVRTQISNQYSSKVHTIEVRAYSSKGTLLARQTKEIDVKMLPEIMVDYVLPDGTINRNASIKTNDDKTGVYLANGVDANFMVTTKNSNSDLDIVVSGDLASKYEFVQEVGEHYVLRNTTDVIEDEDIGKKVKVSFTTYYYLDNGDFEKAECSIEFTIVSFVIHNVSVTNSIDNATRKEIYGYYEQSVDLKFYFDKDDISFYNAFAEGEPFWDTVYEYETDIENKYSGSLSQIYSILKELNSYDSATGKNKYLILNDSNKNADGHYTYSDVPKNVELANNTISVNYEAANGNVPAGEYNPKYLAVAFKLWFDGTNREWLITTYDDTHNNLVGKQQYIVDKNYNLNFTMATPWYEPTVILDEEDFLEMASGGRYILANDLTLTKYVPIDANLIEFDGNGRTITIESFDSFNDEEIGAGLFKRVYADMIVKNVVVKYQSVNDNGNYTFGNVNRSQNKIIYADLCNNPTVNYTSAKFGGIAAINEGIITNCKVEGLIAVHASTIEQKQFDDGGGNYKISFFIGGLVAENSATGYITNSTNKLEIFAQSNIGGFAYSNAGKIASCGVEDVTIYTYNSNLANTIIVELGGFVVNNSGEISMSYVDLNIPQNDKIVINGVKGGTISAKDISAGFAYLNSGNIYDAYVQMNETGSNNNLFAGFVYSNNGNISRAYTFINSGLKIDNNYTMFAPAGTTGLTDCIEIVASKPGYSSGIEKGLKTLLDIYRYNMSYYQEQNFAFGDNSSAVWTMEATSIPKLVSTLEKVEYTRGQNYDGLLSFFKKVEIVDGFEKTTYQVNFANYGTKQNPYIIHDARDYKIYNSDGSLKENYKSSWSTFFTNNTKAYYRIVKDIDFSLNGDNPKTSTMTFKGNIQGNNMNLSGIMLYSTEGLESLGLFKNMESAKDVSIKNSVRNLKLSTTSVWASKTAAVGLLAGVIEDFNIYNITIDSNNIIMVGGNAVGGLAGVVRGEFDIDQISSNVGVNSTRASTVSNYSIYMSKNNKKEKSENLNNVYYAGSIIGILDGYGKTSFNINSRDINSKYYKVRNIRVNSNLVVIGDTIGSAFGLIGEKTHVTNIEINTSGSLSGSQYSAGLVGENRGIVDGAKVVLADDMFADSKYVSAGVVGLNLGGLVRNVDVTVNISKSGYSQTVAGVVGRNVYGTVTDLKFDGELYGYFVGGFVGVNYNHEILLKSVTGSGALSSECRVNQYLIPKQDVKYKEDTDIDSYTNLKMTSHALNSMINNSSKFYSYKLDANNSDDLNKNTTKSRVLGVIVGLSYDELFEDVEVDLDKDFIMFNPISDDAIENAIKEGNLEGVVLQPANGNISEFKFNFTNVRVLVDSSLKQAYVMYLTGAIVSSFDAWDRTYSSDFVVFNNTTPKN